MENDVLQLSLTNSEKHYPGLSDFLKDMTGAGALFDSVAPYLTVGAALERWEINEELFFKELAERNQAAGEEKDYDVKKSFPPFVALFPCGLRNPFSVLFDTFMEEWGKKNDFLIEGNVNHELSYYDYVDAVDDPDALPDLMITSDINSLFHKRFQDRFVDAGAFLPATTPTNPLFHRSGMADPDNKYGFIATNFLVAVVDRDKLGDRPMPERWEDLLAPEFAQSIGVRGEEDFFCHSVSIPYYLLYGKEGLEKLARNIAACYHPAEMVKLCNSPTADSPTVFIMPWFFAQRIVKKDRNAIIFPDEGVFTSPISFFVKKEKAEEFREILDFLTGEKVAQLCEEMWFPSAYSKSSPAFPEDKKLYWVDWSVVRDGDVAELKKEIDLIYEKALDRERRLALTGRGEQCES
ncbi:MAG: ABC transporter substrate-binding protein [Spirochaetales bacterium]|nr:ABC transporter substrate-binding protein [Spirochaetales bacterium]